MVANLKRDYKELQMRYKMKEDEIEMLKKQNRISKYNELLLENQALSEEIGQGTAQIELKTRVARSVTIAKKRYKLAMDLHVIDNGPGIPDHLLPHLFEPFVTSKASGTGLGLALVAKVIGDHGGIVECDSYHNRTIFRIFMPMSRGGAAEEDRGGVEAMGVGGRIVGPPGGTGVLRGPRHPARRSAGGQAAPDHPLPAFGQIHDSARGERLGAAPPRAGDPVRLGRCRGGIACAARDRPAAAEHQAGRRSLRHLQPGGHAVDHADR